MRPGALKQALVVAGCAALAVTVSACQSTEQESAKISREGQLAREAGALKLGAVNHNVRVSDVTLVSSGGRMAVVAKLTSSSGRAQANLPVSVNVAGSAGKVLYSNEAGGLEPSLQHVALLRAHRSAWWVDDQVLSSQHTTGVKLRVGTGTSAPARATANLATTSAHIHVQGGVSVLDGTLVNHSSRAQSAVPVFAVALKGSRVVAAGRVVVASLAGHRGAAAAFEIFLIGDTRGARIEVSAIPTGG